MRTRRCSLLLLPRCSARSLSQPHFSLGVQLSFDSVQDRHHVSHGLLPLQKRLQISQVCMNSGHARMASMQPPLGQPPGLRSKDTDIPPTPNKAVNMHLGHAEPTANRRGNNVQPNSPTAISLTEAFTPGKKTRGTACEKCRKAKVSHPDEYLLTHVLISPASVYS